MSLAVLSGKLAVVDIRYAVAALLCDVAVFGNSLFGIIGPAIIIVIAGIFAIRSNVAKIWKDNYVAEHEGRVIAERERDEQREAKHEALNRVATTEGLLALEKAKTDLTPILSALGDQRLLLEQIRDSLLKGAS